MTLVELAFWVLNDPKRQGNYPVGTLGIRSPVDPNLKALLFLDEELGCVDFTKLYPQVDYSQSPIVLEDVGLYWGQIP